MRASSSSPRPAWRLVDDKKLRSNGRSWVLWRLTVVGIVALLLFDFVFHVRKAHIPTLREAAIWSSLYVGIALLFGVGVLVFGGTRTGRSTSPGYVTEKALSVDNLFVFLIIMTSFRVPRADQQKVLLFGIVFSLIARTGFIFLGAALINSLRLGVLPLRADPADHRRQHAQARGRGRPLGRQHHHPDRPEALPHHRPLRRRQAVHRRERQAGDDPDAAGDGGHRRHRHPLRPRLDPGDLRAHPERLHRLHRHRVLPARPAAAVLPHRRAAGPPDLPVLRAGRDPRRSSASS